MSVAQPWRRALCACWLACACDAREPSQGRRVEGPAVPKAPGSSVTEPPAAPITGAASSQPEADSQACSRLPFFDFYRNARLITLDEPSRVRLQIHIDYHTGAGCIAPDSSGTDLIITLGLRAEGSGCSIETAEVRAVDWGRQYSVAPDAPDRKLRFDSSPFEVLQHLDLTKPDTAAVAIHDPKHSVSASIRRTGVLWYERAQRDSVLHTSVDTQGEETGCCWPSTSTHYREFGVYE